MAVATDVDKVDVVTTACDQIHHRHAFDRQVERRFGRIGRAMHEQQDLVRRALAAGEMLVAHEQLDAWIARRDHGVEGVKPGFFGVCPRQKEMLASNADANKKETLKTLARSECPPCLFCWR